MIATMRRAIGNRSAGRPHPAENRREGRRFGRRAPIRTILLFVLSALFVRQTIAGPVAAPPIVVERLAPADATADAPLLVFVPGLASAPDVWREQAERFSSRGYEAWLVGIAGFAGVPPTKDAGGSSVIRRTAEALVARLEEGGDRRAVLIGHSLGGQIALAAAGSAPERTAGVVVVDSLPFLAALFRPGVTPEQAAASAEAMRRNLESMPPEQARAAMRGSQAVLTRTETFRATLADWLNRSDLTTVIRASSEAMGSDLRPALARVRAPVLVLYARDPAMGPMAEMLEPIYRAQYESLKRVRIRAIDRSFHFIPVDRPQALERALEEFLAELPHSFAARAGAAGAGGGERKR